MNLNIHFDSIFDFYAETDILTPWRRTDGDESWEYHIKEENKSFRGLDNTTILASKYSYKEGLDKLAVIDLDINSGSNRKVYKWSDQDGDEMAMDRLNDMQPFLQQRVNTNGDRNGKFITLHISIGENAGVTYKEMLHRSHAAIQIADYLEEAGYRVGIEVYSDGANVGKFNGKDVSMLHTSITIKKPEEPLNKGLLLNCVSPWMFRYWFFKLWRAKFYTAYGLGQSVNPNYITDKSNIYLETQSCLDKKAVDRRLKEIKQLFDTKNDDE